MYCLQWLIPVLLIPKHLIHPTFLIDQALFLWFYIIGFALERRPCYICMIIFFAAVFFICYSSEECALWPTCQTVLNEGHMCTYNDQRMAV
uniref:Bladder cancer-associated protein n=1 Tax=Ditylenchus dipsaci TaxID=166011 RepID=A0A915DDF5_9BILA